jgi:hypothetical protein
LAIIFFILGTSGWMFGMQADLISVNRRLMEDVSQRIKRMESRILRESALDFPDLTDARWDFPKAAKK